MNIELLKWMCEKAGYQIFGDPQNDGAVVTLGGFHIHWYDWEKNELVMNMWENDFYPLLLQSAIEGVNREATYIIETNNQLISIYLVHPYPEIKKQFDFDDHNDIIAAKAAALEYVWEQERKR